MLTILFKGLQIYFELSNNRPYEMMINITISMRISNEISTIIRYCFRVSSYKCVSVKLLF